MRGPRRLLGTLLAVLALAAFPSRAQVASPHAIEIPSWFDETFLDLREDVRDAARQGKRLMLYFGQDGCPYCSRLMQTNFRQPATVAMMKKHFVAVALNLWGDRDVTWIDGTVMPEKRFAQFLRVQFTPTLLFFDEKGTVVARLNGYYPPHRFDAVLEHVAGHMESRLPLAEYLKSSTHDAASEALHDEPFFLPPPHDLRRAAGAKPLAVLFETNYCAGCDELHREGFRRAEVLALLHRFDVVRLHVGGREALVTPAGERTSAAEWARKLDVLYTPSIVFFDARGKEVFRTEAYLRPFHLAGAFAYVAGGAYRREPSFQRFLQDRTERLRARGARVDLWQ